MTVALLELIEPLMVWLGAIALLGAFGYGIQWIVGEDDDEPTGPICTAANPCPDYEDRYYDDGCVYTGRNTC